MKRLTSFAVGIGLVALVFNTACAAEVLPPGQVDFGKFSPPGSGGEFVEVNLTSNLIGLAAKLIEKQEPDVASILGGLKLVKVNVVGLNDENRGDLQKRTQRIRKELDSKGWERIVTAQKDSQDVGVYLKSKNKDTLQGIVVTVMDGDKQAVFINIVGDITPEQLAMVGEKLHIDPLKNAASAIQKPEQTK